MFSDAQSVCDMTETASVGVLMSNLMKGELLLSSGSLPDRPAAARQIPSKYINRLTEIQGFNEFQNEEYFRKRISDEHQVNRIISHIRRARSLHIMCHIPVFCWISSTVLQKLLKEDLSADIFIKEQKIKPLRVRLDRSGSVNVFFIQIVQNLNLD